MCNNLIDKKVRRVQSSFAVVLLFIAALCLASAGCSGGADKASASDAMPLAARVDRLDGEVGIDRQADPQDSNQDQSKTDWAKATVNTPVSVGSRVYVKDKSHAAIAFSGRNYARLNPRTSLDVLSLSQRRTQLALRDGSGVFDVGALAPGELFEVATPNGAVDFQQPGLYQVGIDDRGSTLVSVLSGIAQVIGLAGSGQVGRGQLLTFGGDYGSEAYVSQLDSGVCGNITNDYYAYRYPTTYDGRYADYQRYQDDPYYYDPYRRSSSYQYIPDDAEVAGLEDLDDYGDWEDVPGHGHSWCPRVSSSWAPYRDGSWYNDQPLGLTWISSERWGWAPYHYGRWFNVNQRWYWVPGEIVSRPLYSPALVAFVAFDQDDRVGWVPLGPGDPYVPRYYDRNYQPQYIGSTTYITQNVNVTNIVNYNVPGAVTVVRAREFTQVITPGTALTADSALLGRSRPVLDPYAVPRLKELAPEIRSHGAKVEITADQALSRSVVTSQDPIAPAVVANTAKALKVKSVPEAEGKHKLQINNSGQTVTAIQPTGLPVPAVQKGQNQTMTAQERDARITALAGQAAQGDKSAKREMRQLQDQQRVQEKVERHAAQQETATRQQEQKQQQKAERKAAQQTATQQQEQKQQQKAERKAAKQTATQQQEQKQQQKAERKAAQQQPAVQQQQQKQEQKAARKAARQEPPVQEQQQKRQQKAERKAARQEPPVQEQQQKQQQKAERKAAAQQQPPVQQQQQQQQQKQQQKVERKAAAQQQPPVQQQQQQQQKQQQKAERKAAAQQQPPVQQQQQQQQKQQQKAERKAAAQQQPPVQQQQQQQKAERKAAQQQQPPAQTSPPKADKKAEKAKNKNNNGSPNQ